MHRPRPNRREALSLGLFAGLGLADGLATPAAARGSLRAFAPRAKSVLHLFLPGGLAHQETFDPKPYAPLAYRGGVRAISTKLDGVQFASHLPKLAGIADKLCVVRSMTHREAAHERGCHSMLTGYAPSPAVVYPSMGSIVSEQLGSRASLPPYVCVPNQPDPAAGSGYLSTTYAPFGLGSDPASRSFGVRDLNRPADVDDRRDRRRRQMREIIGAGFEEAAQSSDGPTAMQAFSERAYELLDSPAAREAFDLSKEPAAMQRRYGSSAAGKRLLLARRLIEAGARYVTVTTGGWDHHTGIARRIGRDLAPVDTGLSALISDLDASGLLSETLVLVTTEFGRTPMVNPKGGRDHWPGAFSILMAGGGLKRGALLGRTDATAAEVVEDPVRPEDLSRTVFTLLGIDPDAELLAGGSRPLRLVRGGRVLTDLFA